MRPNLIPLDVMPKRATDVEVNHPTDLDEAMAQAVAPPVAPSSALPDYVTHAPNTPRTGMLSAEAVVMEFEQTAKEIEKLGEELRHAAKRAEEAQAVLAKSMADLTATAKAYRDEAARVFAQVEAVTTKASEASALCATLREQIASGT
jgi:hypothetical protein